jgi:hypothetical protein
MNPTTRGTLIMAIAPLLAIAACGGDEYTEDGQLVEKTNVRVVGVDLGRAVDSQGRVADGTDTFAPSDTVYASVRTKGSSPKTVLGVRWRNAIGDEINGNNILIRPTGDTSTLFTLRYPHLDPGHYTLDTRVNGKVVKTASFTVSTTAEPRPAPSREISPERQTRFGAIRPFIKKTFAQLTAAAASLFDRAPNDQSPFEWRGLRAGMRFSRLNRLTQLATAWKCTPYFLSSVELERNIALESNDFSAGHVVALVDTTGQRVLKVRYTQSWIPHDTGQEVDFERELTALAIRWDNVPGVIRHPWNAHEGPSYAEWQTPDSLWSGKIFFHQDPPAPARPEGLEIEEIQWSQRLEAGITDSLKAQMHNPASDFYRNPKPNAECDAVLQSR